jgi:hypothetical protein
MNAATMSTSDTPTCADIAFLSKSTATWTLLCPLCHRFVLGNEALSELTSEQQLKLLKYYTASIQVSFKNLVKPIPEVKYVSQAGLAARYTDIIFSFTEN